MTGFLDAYASGPELLTDPLVKPASTFGQRVGANINELMAPDHWYNQGIERYQRWETVRGSLKDRTGEDLPNPYETAPGYKELARYGSHDALRAARSTAIIDAVRKAREQYPDLPDPELIDRQMAEQSRRLRQTTNELEGTGHGLGGFLVSGMASVAIDPAQTAMMLFPGTRVPDLLAAGAVKGFMWGNVAKEAGYQAVTQMGAAGLGQVLDYYARKPLGTEQTMH